MPPSAARKVEKYPVIQSSGAAPLYIKGGNRKVSVAYSKPNPVTPPAAAANDNPRPRDTAIRQTADKRTFANDNTRRVTRDFSHPTTDERFSYSYQQQGLQPSVGSVAPYRNVQTDVTYNQNTPLPTRQIKAGPQPVQDQPRGTVAKAAGNVVRSQPSSSSSPKARTSLNPRKALMKKLPGGLTEGTAGALVDKAFVTEATIMVVPAAGTVWITFQLPLALVSLAAMGIAAGLDSAKQAFESNVVGKAISWVGGFAYDSFNSLLDAAWGVDLNAFSPTTFFILTDGLVMLIGWFTILIIGFVYMFMGISPVFGKGSGAKITALIMSLVFYALPVFNLFPWFGLWALAVWIYPTDE